jgi:hypothetical protein
MFSGDRQKEILQYADLQEYLKKGLNLVRIGKDIVKYALHGFQRNVYTLHQMIAENEHEYCVKHMIKIREAIKQHKQPRTMITQKRTLKTQWQTTNKTC